MSNREYIENKILKLPMGSVFVMSDLDNLTTNNNLRQIIFRLENAGKIRRILPGIYERPYFIKSLNCYAAPDLNQVALAIARRNNWSIAPSGNVALNILGISTQIPAKWEYFSTGPSKTYNIFDTEINFTHRADRELSGMSEKTTLVIQAIKMLGKGGLSKKDITTISQKLSNADKRRILKEARNSTNWIYDEIKRICKSELTYA